MEQPHQTAQGRHASHRAGAPAVEAAARMGKLWALDGGRFYKFGGPLKRDLGVPVKGLQVPCNLMQGRFRVDMIIATIWQLL